MARTNKEIFDELIALKDANTILAPLLTSSSKAAFYRNLFDLFSQFGSDFEKTYDEFVSEIDALMTSKQVHTDTWWRKISLEYQYGDALTTFDNGNLGYDPVNEDNYIIERASVITTQIGAITLKVAKLDTDGITPIPLTTSEKSAFNSYINDRQPSGIVPTIISVDGDEVKVGLSIIIDSQLVNVEDGTLLSDGTTKPVEDAIYDYFAIFQDDDFGGVFYANNLISRIIAATGVVNATFTLLTKKGANETDFTSVLELPGKSFATFSGYVKMADGYDLSGNITYTAEIDG